MSSIGRSLLIPSTPRQIGDGLVDTRSLNAPVGEQFVPPGGAQPFDRQRVASHLGLDRVQVVAGDSELQLRHGVRDEQHLLIHGVDGVADLPGQVIEHGEFAVAEGVLVGAEREERAVGGPAV